MATPQQMERRERVIIQMRKEGKSNIEIAKRLRIPLTSVARSAMLLIQKGKIQPIPSKPFWHDRRNTRFKMVINMVRQRRSSSEIGQALGGITEKRACQLIAKIQKRYGKTIFEPKEKIWNAVEAGRELGVPDRIIHKICAKGEIPCLKRAKKRGMWLIDEVGMEMLRRHPNIQKLQKTSTSDRLTAQRLRSWQKKLVVRLSSRSAPEKEEWISFSEALRITGLKQTTLYRLASRGIISTHTDPTRLVRWSKKPTMLYSAEEIAIVHDVYKEHIQRKQARPS